MRAHDRLVQVLRWTAVLPGALVGAGLLQLVLVVAYTAIAGTGEGGSAALPLAMRTARTIAPSHKNASAAAMAVLFATVSAAVWLARIDVGAAWDRYATVVSVMAALVTAYVAQRASATPARA